MNENNPLITIVVPAYNVQDTIDRTLEQISEQSYGNIEILCINDGLTDNIRALIKI